MGCEGCGSNGGTPSGCGNNGHCESGGCSKLQVYDWLSDVGASAYDQYDIHEISFKNGARKEFFRNEKRHDIITGDYVLVETGSMGYDIGEVTLSGELVKMQMHKKQKSKRNSSEVRNIIRVARDGEMDKLKEARSREKETMLRARIMARDLGLDMKLGDVEFQADLRKATFFYTAEERVDFRELIKVLAQEFRVKIEMRQIGARQEAGRVGGIGSCGRELCCSSWLTNFKSVNTTAARYQNLSINQTKLSGQCGRLKCCLNYELDTYLEALREFPDQYKAKKLNTVAGEAFLVKTDILKGLMSYTYAQGNTFYPLKIEDVKMVLEMNAKGERPEDLNELVVVQEEKEVLEFEDVVGQIDLKSLEQNDRRKRNRNRNKKRSNSNQNQNRKQTSGQSSNKNRPHSKQRSNQKGKEQSSEKKQPNKPSNQGGSNKSRRNNRRRNPNKGQNPNKPEGPKSDS